MPEKKEVVDKTQTDPTLNRFFTDDEITDEELEDQEQEEESQEETEEANDDMAEEEPEEPEEPEVKTKDKFDGKSRDEVIEAYRNLEALFGKQAQELGESRKKDTAPVDTTIYDMSNLADWPDSVLDSNINMYEEYLQKPDQNLNDSDNFGRYTVQHNRMLAEKSKREVLAIHTRKQVGETNAKIISEHAAKQYLSLTELERASKYAIDRLSDDGTLTSADLDVAVHKLFPDKWAKLTADKEKVRMTTAQTARTPMMPTSGNQPRTAGLKSAEEISKMSETDYERYLDTLSPTQLAKLQEKLNKRG